MKAYESVTVCWFKKGEEKEKNAALQAAVQPIQLVWETVALCSTGESPALLVMLVTLVWAAKCIMNMQQFDTERPDVSFLVV